MSNEVNDVAQAIYDTLQTPNEPDRNGEPANVVDAIAALSRATIRLGTGIAMSDEMDLSSSIIQAGADIRAGLEAIAEAIDRIPKA